MDQSHDDLRRRLSEAGLADAADERLATLKPWARTLLDNMQALRRVRLGDTEPATVFRADWQEAGRGGE